MSNDTPGDFPESDGSSYDPNYGQDRRGLPESEPGAVDRRPARADHRLTRDGEGLDERWNVAAEVVADREAQPAAAWGEQLSLFDTEMTTGPIPGPTMMARYGQVDPSFPERLMRMAERDQENQHANLDKATDAEIDYRKSGQNAASAITLISLIAAIAFFAFGNHVAGGCLLGLPLVMLVRAFLAAPQRNSQPTRPNQDAAGQTETGNG